MSSANLNIVIVERRMLKPADAATYCGLPAKHFKTDCPVTPVELRPGVLVYDKRDLDRWIDGIKDGADAATKDSILGKLR